MIRKSIQILAMAAIVMLAACNKKNEINVAQFETEAAKYLDKEVVIADGKVDHVCAHSSKKMTLTDAKGETKITCMAGKELGKYDTAINDKNVKVVAIVKEQKLDEEYFNKWEQSLREELAEMMDTTKKGDAHGHNHDEADATHHHSNFDDTMKIKKYREEIKSNGKGYISKYYLEAKSVEILK